MLLTNSVAITTALSWALHTGVCEASRRTSTRFLSSKQSSEREREITWPHRVVSQVHALVVTAWSLWCIALVALASPEERFFASHTAARHLAAFSLGYFCWDVGVCVQYFGSEYGPVFLLHGCMSAVAMAAAALGGYCPWFVPRTLLFEVSTLFLNAHWFMEKTGWGSPGVRLANDALALVSYLGIRVGYGTRVFLAGVADFGVLGVERVGVPFLVAAVALMTASWSLNVFWSWKLLQQAFALLTPKATASGNKEGSLAGKRRGSGASLSTTEVAAPLPARSLRERHATQ